MKSNACVCDKNHNELVGCNISSAMINEDINDSLNTEKSGEDNITVTYPDEILRIEGQYKGVQTLARIESLADEIATAGLPNVSSELRKIAAKWWFLEYTIADGVCMVLSNDLMQS